MHSSRTKSRPKVRLNISDIGSGFRWVSRSPAAIRGTLSVAVLSALLLVVARLAQAQTQTVLYNFTGGSDGANPQSRLTHRGGNFYGTAYEGGAFGAGTVFQLSPNGSGGWNETVLHNFSGGLGREADGAGPSGPVIFDNVGNLYGTTRFGGTDPVYCSYGSVFELSRVGGIWTETIPFSESCTQPDGIAPVNGLIMDSAGNLYGTTLENGPIPGTVFELSPSGGSWTQRVIYSAPTSSGLTMDATGNIYGVTRSTVFELSPNGNGGWNSTIIHTFAGYPNDGSVAEGTPVVDQSGNIYGTTYEGGVYNHGTVYKLSPGETEAWTENILYSFPSGKNGANPVAGIVFDAAGNIYGTTALGGSKTNKGQGTVFELATLGNSNYQHTVLWTFNGADGANPYGSLILDKSGQHLYGTTNSGGLSNAGVVFKVNGVRTATTTWLTSSSNPSTYAQPVTFTAVVASGLHPPPNGETVTFKQGATVLGTVALSGGSAGFTTSTLPVGSYYIKAVYDGDSKFVGSTSNTVMQVVKKAATTASLTSSPNPSAYGQTVTFIAVVTSGSHAPPDGETITFKEGITVLGTGVLSGGSASFTTSTLLVGTHAIRAGYAGDVHFLTSTSNTLKQVVH